MEIMDFSAESLRLTNVMNYYGFSLPLINLSRETWSYSRNIGQVMNNLEDHNAISAGSMSEGLYVHLSEFEPSDMDIVILGSEFKIYENTSEQFNCEALCPTLNHMLRLPDNANPGYSKLAVLQIRQAFKQYCYFQDSTEFLKNTLKEKMIEFVGYCTSIHGPAVYMDSNSLNIYGLNRGFSPDFSLPEYEKKTCIEMLGIEADWVLCLIGEKWPDEALEWQVRERKYQWPTKELLNEIIKSGYFLAPVGSKQSNESEIQWRLSFNKAELLLIKSFNETQIHCIMFLKLLKIRRMSIVAGKNITSYSLKTLMFWCIEEKSEEFWQLTNLVHCICFCIKKLKYFVENVFLPDYFISKRNQFNSNEFTQDKRIKTKQCLESFLEDPIGGITLLLPIFQSYEYRSLSSLNSQLTISKQTLIMKWLSFRIATALTFHSTNVHKFVNFYHGHSIVDICMQLKEAKKKLKDKSYTQPYIKLLLNCIAVLQYILIKNEKDTYGSIKRSDKKKENLRNLKSSCSADISHSSLRIATCFLDDGAKEDSLKMIQAVTAHPMNQLSINEYRDRVSCLGCLNVIKDCNLNEMEKYIELMEQDLRIKNPYKTIEKLEQNRKKGFDMRGYDVFSLAWKKGVFDVTFMVAELPILPKPVALELCIDQSQRTISFHPYLYGLFLKFLWYERYDSRNQEKESILEKMKNCGSIIPDKQQSRRLNLITYCYLLQKDYLSASRYLIQSFKLNPDKHNVAYMHIKHIINCLLNLSFRWKPSRGCIILDKQLSRRQNLITFNNSLQKEFHSFSRYLNESLTPNSVDHYLTHMFLYILNLAFLIVGLSWPFQE